MLPWKMAKRPIPNGIPLMIGIQTLKLGGEVHASQNRPAGKRAQQDMTGVS